MAAGKYTEHIARTEQKTFNIVRQEIALQRKTSSCITDVADISSKPTPLCSPSLLPSLESNSISIASLLKELAYLAMLFILRMTCIARSAGQKKKK